MNITDTVDMMMEVVNMAPDSLAVKESVIHCLGDLASVSTSAANAIADPKCVQLVLTAAKDTSSDVFAVESSGAEQASAQSLMTTAKAVRGFVWTVWVVWAVCVGCVCGLLGWCGWCGQCVGCVCAVLWAVWAVFELCVGCV